jgi:membrane complex biogenesis BtpA family protein
MNCLNLFRRSKPIIGMLHVPALPGSPLNTLGIEAIVKWVLDDTEALAEGGVDGLMIENFGDVPFYPRRVQPHTVAFMTKIAVDVRQRFELPLGINILRNDAESALAVAAAVGAQFIRVNIYIGARVTDKGLIEGKAHRILRYRQFVAPGVKIFADVDTKHSAPLSPRPLEEEVEELVLRGRADAVIVTGTATGKPTAPDDIAAAKHASAGTGAGAPVFAGSGVDVDNIAATLGAADGLIIGTAFKRDRVTTNPVDASRVRALLLAARRSGVDSST